MTLINIINNFKRTVMSVKYKLITIFLIGYICTIYIANKYVKSLPTDIKVSVFDMLCDVNKGLGIIGVSRYIFPIIPTFIIILIIIIDFDKNYQFLLRYNSRKNIWKKQFMSVIITTLTYSILTVLGGYLISGILLGSFYNKWINSEGMIYKLLAYPNNWSEISSKFITYKILLFVFISNFLGLCVIGELVCIGKIFFKNQYIFLLAIISLFASRLFGKFSIILNQMTNNLSNFIFPITIIKNYIYLSILILIFYILGNYVVEKYDIIDAV